MKPSRRRGFTLVEVMVASGVMAVLAALISACWSGLGRPAVDLAERHRVVQEAHLAVASLARDLGGTPGGPDAAIGRKEQGRFVAWLQPGESQLWLCYDGGEKPNGAADWGPPDTVIVYQKDSDSLVRYDQTADASFIVARHVETFQAVPSGDTAVEIRLGFKYRTAAQSYTFVARSP